MDAAIMLIMAVYAVIGGLSTLYQHARRIRMEMLSQSEISHCAFELIS